MAGKFELYKDKAGEFRFRLKAGNGENILASEGYKKYGSCVKGIESVQKNARDSTLFETKLSASGKHYFVLKAANHLVIGKSELYESSAACANGVASVAKNAPAAKIVDLALQ